MIKWEAHACLPLHPHADFAPLDAYRGAGVDYVSINVGMDMDPLSQVLSVIAGFRAKIAAHPDRYQLASTVADIERAATSGRLAIGFVGVSVLTSAGPRCTCQRSLEMLRIRPRSP